MSTVMTVAPLEELEPNLVCSAENVTNLVCAAENVINSVVSNLSTYFVVEAKCTSWKGEELMQSNIYNPVRRNTNII